MYKLSPDDATLPPLSCRAPRHNTSFFISELHGNISHTKVGGHVNIKLVLSTEASEGLVVWHGDLSGTRKDFLAIAINEGTPTVTFNLGSGPNAVFGAAAINDGDDHLVEVSVHGRTVSIKVDQGQLVSKDSKDEKDRLGHLGNWHIGGLMDPDTQAGGWFQKGFTGCIKSFVIQKKRINFQRDSVRTANLV